MKKIFFILFMLCSLYGITIKSNFSTEYFSNFGLNSYFSNNILIVDIKSNSNDSLLSYSVGKAMTTVIYFFNDRKIVTGVSLIVDGIDYLFDKKEMEDMIFFGRNNRAGLSSILRVKMSEKNLSKNLMREE